MSSFIDWHFCHEIQLSPREMADYLDLLAVFRSKSNDCPTMEKALALLDAISLQQQVYALPLLVDNLYCREKYRWMCGQTDELAQRKVVRMLRRQIIKCLKSSEEGKENSDDRPVELASYIDGQEPVDLAKIKDLLALLSSESEATAENCSYLQAERFGMDIAVLSLLEIISRQNPQVIERVEEANPQLLESYYKGYYGMLPQYLALLMLGNAKKDFEFICTYFPSDWMLYPEYMRLAAQTAFSQDSEAELDALIVESCTFAFYQKYHPKVFQKGIPIWFSTVTELNNDTSQSRRRVQREQQSLSAILWQAVLWERAVEIAPSETLRRLNTLWQTPIGLSTKGRNERRQQIDELFLLRKINITSQWLANETNIRIFFFKNGQNSITSAISTPWQLSGGGNNQYSCMKTSIGALRAFAALCVLRPLLHENPDCLSSMSNEKPVNILRVLINFGAAFGTSWARREIENPHGKSVWSYTLYGLGLYANKVLTSIGTGKFAPSLPGELLEQLSKIERTRGKYHNPELQILANKLGQLTFASWAYQAQLSVTVSRKGSIKVSPWEDYKYDICSNLFSDPDNLPPQEVRDSAEACWLYETTGVHLRQRLYPFPGEYWYAPRDDDALLAKVDVYELLRTEAPQYDHWLNINLREADFTQEAWLIALTLRIQSGLVRGSVPVEWIQSWRDSLFLNADIREHLTLFPILIDLLRTPAPDVIAVDADHKLYDLILDTIIEVVDLNVSDDTIFYLFDLICALVGAEQLFGMATLTNGCTNLLFSLDGRPVTEPIWKELKLYLIHQLAKTNVGRVDRFKMIVTRLNSHLHDKCESARKKHYAVHDVKNDWNSLTDHFLQYREEHFVVSRRRLKLQSPRLFNGFVAGETRAVTQVNRLGLVCRKWYSMNDRIHSRYFLHTGSNQLEEKVLEEKAFDPQGHRVSYKTGDLVQFNDHTIQDVYFAQAFEGDLFNARIQTISTSKGVELEGFFPRVYLKPEEKSEFVPSVLNYWAPDTLAYVNGAYPVTTDSSCTVVYRAALKSYVPLERDFFRLLIDEFYSKESEAVITLHYIESEYLSGGDSALFSVKPGFNYRLFTQDWSNSCFDALKKNVFDHENALGIKVPVRLAMEGDFPHLYVDIEEIDCSNQQWAELFNSNEVYTAIRDSNYPHEYHIQCDWNGKERFISVDIDFKAPHQATMNVELTDNGWDLTRQRLRKAFMTPCDTHFVRLSGTIAQQCETIRKIRDLKVGNILKLITSTSPRGRVGYCNAIVPALGLRVNCSLESLSLSTQTPLSESLTKGRFCIVEKVTIVTDNNFPHRPEKFFNPQEKIEGDVLLGIITEIVNKVGANTGNQIVKTAFLYGDTIRKFDLPYSTFNVPPRNAGDRVSLHRDRDGWFATAEWRRINVRALWSGKLHSSGELAGEYLGLIRIPGQPLCCATQDTSQPILHFWPQSLRIEAPDQVCSIPISEIDNLDKQPLVLQKGPLYSDWEAFPYARRRSVVCLNYQGRQIWGEAATGDFENGSSQWKVEVEVTKINVAPEIEPLYDVRRVFKPRFSREDLVGTQRSRRENKKDWYSDWYNYSDRSLFGTIHNGKFHLSDREFPPTLDGDYTDQWLTDLPFCEEEPLWYKFSKSTYLEGYPARVKMLYESDCWLASCRQAPPFSLGEKLLDVFSVAAEEIIDRYTLYFTGPDENGQLRFEWGYGYTLLVSSENVVDMSNGIVGTTLFYGDYVTKFMIRCDDGLWKLYLDLDSLHKSVEHRIWYDAMKANIVQLLRVIVNKEKRQVHIISVSISEGQIGSTEKYLLGWEWSTPYSSTLDEESKQLLLQENTFTHEMCIFAVLRPNGTRGEGQKQLVFHYISLKQGDSHAVELKGKRVCLAAGKIHSNFDMQLKSLGNDYFLKFYLPTELPQVDCESTIEHPTITVSVMRRNFSLDESKLRTSFSHNGGNDFYGQHMLVTLLSEGNKQNGDTYEWQGSIIRTPLRSTDSLKKWVRSQPACIVSLGLAIRAENQTDDEASETPDRENTVQICVEVAPGILSKICKDNIIGEYHAGAIAQLFLEENQIMARTLLPSDRSYFPQEGRTVELLVMDSAAKQFKPQGTLQQETGQWNFTVASFPQIRIKSPYIGIFMKMPWPRIGYVTPDRFGWSISDPNAHPFPKAAFLQINPENNQPLLHFFGDRQECQSQQWSQLSFMDNSCSVIADTVKKGVWHYHDKCYALSGTDGSWNVKSLPSGENYQDIVIFPGPHGHLRIRSEFFRKYGYSAHELIEYGLPNDRSQFPIAGIGEGSIWIEVYPSRIVELPKSLLFIGKHKQNFNNFALSLLSAGDEITLETDFGFKGGQRRFTVVNLRYGLRSNLPATGCAFLPVLECLPDGVRLGNKHWQMIYPCEDIKRVQGHSMVALTHENLIDPERKLRRGDTVFVRFDGNSLHIEYNQNLNVFASNYEEHWHGALWLRNWICDLVMKKRFFSAIKSSLPLEVVSIPNGEHIYVGYSQPEESSYPVGTFLYSVALGLVVEGDTPYVILRAGKLLLHIPYEQLLPGFPPLYAEFIVDHLREHQTGIWLHKTDNGWTTGINDQSPARGEINVYLLDWIGSAHGILCCAEETLSLLWLPVGRSSFVRLPTKGDTEREKFIWQALKQSDGNKILASTDRTPPPMSGILKTAHYVNGNEISLVEPNAIDTSRFLRAKLRATPLVEMKKHSMYECIAELYPRGDLIELYSESDNFTWGTPQSIIISKIKRNAILAVVEDSMRERIRLSPMLCARYHTAWNSSDENPNNGYLLTSDQTNYEMCCRASDDVSNQVETDLSTFDGTDGKLVYLYTFLKSGRRLTRTWFQQSFGYLRRWLSKEETIQLLGEAGAKKRYSEESFCEILTAVLLMRFLGTQCNDLELRSNIGKLAVHTARMLGLACEASIQQEILLNCIKAGDRGGLWKRLYKLDLRGTQSDGSDNKFFYGTLNPQQYRQLLRTCEYILHRSSCNDSDLLLTAESLLYAIGKLDDFDSFEAHLDKNLFSLLFWQFAKIARTLTPRGTNLLAFDSIPEVLNWQLDSLWDEIQKKHFITAPLYLDNMDGKTIAPFTETQKREIKNLVESCRDGLDRECHVLQRH